MLISGGEIPESDAPPAGLPKEHIPHVYFKQYLPVSNKVIAITCYLLYVMMAVVLCTLWLHTLLVAEIIF